MQIAWPTAAGADPKLPGEMRLGASSCDFLMSHVNPLDLALVAEGVSQPIQAVAHNAISPLNPSRGK